MIKKNCGTQKNGFDIPVNYIEPILEYLKQRFFQLTKTPEKLSRQEVFPYDHRYYGCIHPTQTKKDVKK